MECNRCLLTARVCVCFFVCVWRLSCSHVHLPTQPLLLATCFDAQKGKRQQSVSSQSLCRCAALLLLVSVDSSEEVVVFFHDVSIVPASYHAVSQLSACLHLASAIWCVCLCFSVCVCVCQFDVFTCICVDVMCILLPLMSIFLSFS